MEKLLIVINKKTREIIYAAKDDCSIENAKEIAEFVRSEYEVKVIDRNDPKMRKEKIEILVYKDN